MKFIYTFLLFTSFLLTTYAPAHADEILYDLVDLGGLPEETTEGFGLSNPSPTGLVLPVGTRFNLSTVEYEASSFTPHAPLTTSLGARGIALGVSANGERIVGGREYGDPASPLTKAFISSAGSITNIPVPSPTPESDSEAYGVNNSGMIVGAFSWITDIFLYKHAFVFENGGTEATDLHDLFPDWEVSAAFAVNEVGHVVGYHDRVGFIHKGTAFHDLVFGDEFCFSKARAINEDDMVVGSSDCARSFTDVTRSAVLWKFQNDGLPRWVGHDLGTLGGHFRDAFDINNRFWIVGRSTLRRGSGDGYHGFLWRNHHGMVDLNSVTAMPPGFEIYEARAINDRNEILANTWYERNPGEGSFSHAVLLVPRHRP